MKEKFKRVNLLHLIKAGLGSAVAIFLANRFNLLYSASAGIITLLTIQNTKKETIRVAFKRMLGFLVAVLVFYIVSSNFGFTALAFGGFIFVFVAISNFFELESGISMNAVLVTHFLIEKRIDIPLIFNEAYLLIIGMSIGVLVNLIMPKNIEKIKSNQIIVEENIKSILSCMADILKGGQRCKNFDKLNSSINFESLNSLIDDLLVKAYEDAGNTLLSETRYHISYLEMRKLQVAILKDIYGSIERIHDVLPQSVEISTYLKKVSNEFHELNNVEDLLVELDKLYDFFRKESLPKTRKEFENRAILFNILRDLEQFLQLKHSFIKEG